MKKAAQLHTTLQCLVKTYHHVGSHPATVKNQLCFDSYRKNKAASIAMTSRQCHVSIPAPSSNQSSTQRCHRLPPVRGADEVALCIKTHGSNEGWNSKFRFLNYSTSREKMGIREITIVAKGQMESCHSYYL